MGEGLGPQLEGIAAFVEEVVPLIDLAHGAGDAGTGVVDDLLGDVGGDAELGEAGGGGPAQVVEHPALDPAGAVEAGLDLAEAGDGAAGAVGWEHVSRSRRSGAGL